MKRLKTIASVLFYLSRICAFIYAIITVYSLGSLLTGWSTIYKEGYFDILFPFTQTTLLKGEYNIGYILFNLLMVLVLYSVFFWLLGNVFKVFTQQRLFTKQSIKHLNYFYRSNFLVPTMATLLSCFFTTVNKWVIMLIILHFILGVFSYFLAAIFQQGVSLQNEQDLYI